jgi:putative glycosyltransferase (TIGR04372 family)
MFCLTGKLAYSILDIAKRVEKPQIYFESTNIDRNGLLIEEKLPTLEFLKSEISTGQKFISDCGTDRENRFVCLNVRDKTFLEKSEPIGWSRNRDWSYHNYRDSDIKTYVAAAEALAEMGYTVFRMGAIVKEPLISKHPRVIDYATNGMRTEFLDIFLGAHCAFAVSTSSGWDAIPAIFRRPMLLVNQLPIFAPSVVTLDLASYPKILLDCDSSEVLTLQQLIERGAATPSTTQAYKDAGVVIRDLSSEELVNAVTEMAQRVEGTFVETPEQKEMQAKAKHILSTHPKLQPSPNHYPIRAQFASCFLSRYPNFLDGLN